MIGSPSKCQMRNVECWNGVDFHTTQREIRNQQRVLSLTDGQPPLTLSLSLSLPMHLSVLWKEGGRGNRAWWLQVSLGKSVLAATAAALCGQRLPLTDQIKMSCPACPSIYRYVSSVCALPKQCLCVCATVNDQFAKPTILLLLLPPVPLSSGKSQPAAVAIRVFRILVTASHLSVACDKS